MKKSFFAKAGAHLILLAGSVIMVYPLVFIIMISFFTPEEFNRTVIQLLPVAKEPTLDNFKLLFFVTADKYTITYYLNSIFRTFYQTTFSVLTSLLGGYVFARLRFKGKEILFLVLLATQMIPGIISVMPMYLQLRTMGVYDT